ncbi:unnamed protein product [Peronospora farinosa]|uniref:Uncharacterized protein n=1 Tax=Peronospora farinosa TaxID=134698 RepID=A0AAV0TWG6_9STRA|nr:unnamed protein product [Peronospora farinosa]CAI5728263.1 unnamed protein product [Peronospora farinosa]
MCWRGCSSKTATEDGYEWIYNYLNSCDEDLLEFELDVDGQHFFDNMELHPTSTPQPNEHNETPLQLTPFVLSVISELPSQPASHPESVSYCALLEEAQSTAKTTDSLATQREDQAARHAVTTPRKGRTRGLKYRHDKTATTLHSEARIDNCMRPTTRSSSRKKFNRRLFY